jgi:bacterioferritin-associated ferredoxin
VNSAAGPSEKKLICFCNKVLRSTVESLADSGSAKTLPDVYDQCGAGVGPCGGSCRDEISKILSQKNQSPSPSAPAEPSPISMEMVHAISLFNRRYYWETHEVLEDVWREQSGSEKIFTQALIQAAAALYHVLNANPMGVIKLSQSSSEKFRSGNPAQWGVDCSRVIEALKYYEKEAREIMAGGKSGFDYTRLPTLTHGTNMSSSGTKSGE